MQAFHQSKSSANVLGSPLMKNGHCCSFRPPLTEINTQDVYSQGTTLCFQPCNEEFTTLDSSVSTLGFSSSVHDSTPKVTYNSWSSGTYGNCANMPNGERRTWNNQVIPSLDIKEGLISCAKAISDGDIPTAVGLMDVLEKMVSISGYPTQRLGAYLLEGLRARLESSGNLIYKKLRCDQPTGPELMSSMYVLYQVCPYWKFAYASANAVIQDAVQNEPRIHIIDFQIAQGSQWVPLIESLSRRACGVPSIRITGVDDTQSAIARGGGLEIIGRRLSTVAESCGVHLEFQGVSMQDHEVHAEHLMIHPDEAVVVNFPYVLHHIPDESVSVQNHRDRLMRMVKGLSPKVVTLIEQESNTNTSPFYTRFLEMMDYYSAMFESIDMAPGMTREDPQRIRAEQNCVARDIVNMVACEGAERVERHELLGKWRSRFTMAGFQQCSLSSSVARAVLDMLEGEYSRNYRIEEINQALYLKWKNRAMVTCSAWR